jgi:C-terminal processing protease CtpA/Prc
MGIFNEAAQGSIFQMGAREPFFASEQVRQSYALSEVEPSEAMLEKYGVKRSEIIVDGKFPIYAALYRYEGKNILLVRQESYIPEIDFEKLLAAYRALLDQYEEMADVLVIDQNHNPGGYLPYVMSFFRMFIPKGEQAAQMVQRHNADRRWYFSYRNWAAEVEDGSFEKAQYLQNAAMVEEAIDAGQSMTEPFTIGWANYLSPDPTYTWTKPMLVLTDELSGSCGDIFPMLIKSNKVAKIFGERTMGLGGNVEHMGQLPNSGAEFFLTRGLFTTYKENGKYGDKDWVENNGVTPDIHYAHTVEDFRAGFVKYFVEMSKAAVAQIK